MKGFRKTAVTLIAALLVVTLAPFAAAAQAAPAAPAESDSAAPVVQDYGDVVVAILTKLGAGGDVDKFEKAGIGPREAVVLAAIANLSGQPVDETIGLARGGKTAQEIAEQVGVDWQEVQDKVAEAIGFKGDNTARLQQLLTRLNDQLAKAQEAYQKLNDEQTAVEQRIADAQAKLDSIKNDQVRHWAEVRIQAEEMRLPIIKLQIERTSFIVDMLQQQIAEVEAELNK